MAIPHASPCKAIDISPLKDKLAGSVTSTLIKTDQLEVIRLIVPAGKAIAPHKVAGEVTVQCLEGRLEITTELGTEELQAGQMLYFAGGQDHSVKGLADSSALVTILL